MTILVNNKPLDTFKFSGGECHIKIDVTSIGGKTEIVAPLKRKSRKIKVFWKLFS